MKNKPSKALSPLLKKNEKVLQSLCEKFHVRKLEVFGSVVRDDFDPEHSDVAIFWWK